ncbi:DUF1360 domain-containing protein [Gorillibacterium sp. sgz5001074]|uniref:DUF1360 domain-containing protein n=1 Tax=Gorillibacterium sp. sgz5001074 TaxID=3446695 RepID=UPI003F67724D
MTTLIVLFLAAYRLTHLIVFDKVFEPIRNLFVRRYYNNSPEGLQVQYRLQGGPVSRFIGQIMNCFWCTGMWVSFGVVGVYVLVDWMYWCLMALALAGFIGILGTWWTKQVGFPEASPKKEDEPA